MSVPSEPDGHARDPRSVRGGLPAVYATDPTAQAFATAIDAMLAPVDQTLERLPDNFDAFAAPAELLPYLVRVSQARVEPSWPERAVRAAIDLAPWLAVHRGTPAALIREASVVYGWTLSVADPGGVCLPADALTWPTDGTLHVDLDPLPSGWEPVNYNQGSLERLINAHVPASAPRILAPPPGRCALYEGTYSTGRALLVSHDIADLATSGFDNTASSVWNRSNGILALYEEPDFGEGGSRQFVPALQAVNVIESMNKRASSVKFLTGVPADAWGLLDADGNLLGVYDGDVRHLESGVGAAATSLVNNTIHTLRATGTRPEVSQVIYPGVTEALDPGVALELSQVTVYIEVPAGAFCLYQFAQRGGKQWMLWTRPGDSVSLAMIGADNVVSSVCNRTEVTLELWENSDGTGASEFFYPGTFADVGTGLAGRVSLVTVLNGAPAGHYCLYGGPAKTGKQWVFRDLDGVTIELTDPRVAAGDAVLSVENLTFGTLELFENNNGSGHSQLFYPGLAVEVDVPTVAGVAKSVTAYDQAPDGYYCLYANTDKTGNRWVFRGTEMTMDLTRTDIDAGDAVSLVENKTNRTLALFKDSNGTGDRQYFYPGITAAVTVPGLDKKAKSSTVYYRAPDGHYCLYGSPLKQWIFPAAPGTDTDLAPSGAAGNVAAIDNNTAYTIELFVESNGAGAHELFYPQTNVGVGSGLLRRATNVRCYDGPPAGYFCLYDDMDRAGSQWVFPAAPGAWWNVTSRQNWKDKVSSVWNRTQNTIQLFEYVGLEGRGELFYPDRSANVTTIDNMANSVTCYDGCPPGYYCLYEGAVLSGNQYVLPPDIGTIDLGSVGASSKVSSVRNLTNYTIQLWTGPGPSGEWQLCYPSQEADVRPDLDNEATSVTVHDGPPPDWSGYYCLYEYYPRSGRQWLFHESSREVDLAGPGIGVVNVGCVRNNTTFTLQLFAEAGGHGDMQLFYPGLLTPAVGVIEPAKHARLHRVEYPDTGSLPFGYFCLFEQEDWEGVQWLFEAGAKVTLTDIDAADKVSSAANGTSTAVTLYSNDDWTGFSYRLPAGQWHPNLTGTTTGDPLNNAARSVWNV